jgi:hypothetical protein
MLSAHNTPDLRQPGVSLAPAPVAQAMAQLKRTLSQDAEANLPNGDSESANARRSKRAKKGKRSSLFSGASSVDLATSAIVGPWH